MSQKGIKSHEKDRKSWYLHCSQKSGSNTKNAENPHKHWVFEA